MHVQEINTERSLKTVMSHGKGFIKAFLEYCPNSRRETMMKIDEAFLYRKVLVQ